MEILPVVERRRVQSASDSGFTLSALLTPSAFPHAVSRLETRETHISWVILTGPFAYKVKKRVQLDFLDTTTLAQRRHLCEEEVRLNRRFAPDLYLDVVAITNDSGGLRVGGQEPIVEYAVRMKQFDTSQELSSLLVRGEVAEEEIVDLAESLARLHVATASAPRSEDFQYTEQLRSAVLGNLATLLSHLDVVKGLPEMGRLIDWTHNYLESSLAEFRTRERSGFIRECHGDLHSRNIVRWQGRLTPFDCLEFDPKLRWIDVINDIAFLVMDLAAHGRKDLAALFLNRYLENTGDYAGMRLLSFYAVYRALVRAMVDSLEAERNPEQREAFQERLRARLKTAAEFMSPPAATLVIMHGPSGSGKSWLSERLVAPLEAVRLRSDVERKRLAGAAARDHRGAEFEQGIYAPQFTHRTYARLLECAESCLKGGVNAIIDATFLKRAERRMFQDLAARQRARYVILSCQADAAVLAQRIATRRQTRADPSDADVAVLERQLHKIEPLGDDERPHLIAVDTAHPQAISAAVTAVRSQMKEMWL